MKRIFLFLTVLALAAMSLSAQGAKEAQSAIKEEPKTHIVVDHQGVEVEVPYDIKRIGVYNIYPLPSVLTVFFNSADKIVSMSKPSLTAAENGLLGELYPEILSVETASVSNGEINIEELMKQNPDIVFINGGDATARKALSDAGIPAVGISVNKWHYDCIETLDNWISLLAELFPEDADKVQTVHDYSYKVYDMIQDRVKDIPDEERVRVFVLFQYSTSTMLTSGKNFFGQWWCDAIGAKNVAEELEKDNSVAVTMEQVYKWNPDAIVITNFTSAQPETLYANGVGSDDWSGIKAVKDGRVYKTPLGMYRSYTPGVDAPVSLLWWAKAIYPEKFADVDLNAVARDYYKTVFNVDLAAEQINSIFTPTAAAAGGF